MAIMAPGLGSQLGSLYRYRDVIILYPLFPKWFDWGPGQPSGRDQHCLYIVGGFLGYQWADFNCEFEVKVKSIFLCSSVFRCR